MRAMVLEFMDDKMCQYLDKQYMLGTSLLVAPIFNEEGIGEYYLPEEGYWTDFFTGERRAGGKWYTGEYGYCEIPLIVRPNTILPIGSKDNDPEYDYAEQVTFRIYELTEEASIVLFNRSEAAEVKICAKHKKHEIEVQVEAAKDFTIELVHVQAKAVLGAKMELRGKDTVLYDCVSNGCIHIEI